MTVTFEKPAINSGKVYCTAFLASKNTVITSSSQITVQGYSAAFLRGATDATVTVGAQSPVTDYDVYCFVRTTEGYESKLTETNDNVLVATTACCMQIFYTNAPKYILADVSEYTTTSAPKSYVFAFELSHAPRSFIDVIPTITFVSSTNGSGVVNTSLALIAAQPANFNYLQTATSEVARAGTFVIVPDATLLGPGEHIFEVGLAIMGNSTADFVTTSTLVSIVQSFLFKDPPQITSVRFGDGGILVYIVFDSETDEAGKAESSTWACNQLFTFVGDSVSTCNFINSSAVVIKLPKYSTTSTAALIEIGDNVTLLDGKLKAYCEIYISAETQDRKSVV